MAFLTKHTSPSELLFIINKLPKNKSPDHNLINNHIIKNLPKKAIIFLTYIYNFILYLSHILSTWKHSIIILIHKPGKPPECPSSYISLLPSFSKNLEKVLLKRIYPIINDLDIIPLMQLGFRNKHLPLHQVHRITDIISSYLEAKNTVKLFSSMLPRNLTECGQTDFFTNTVSFRLFYFLYLSPS